VKKKSIGAARRPSTREPQSEFKPSAKAVRQATFVQQEKNEEKRREERHHLEIAPAVRGQ